MTDVTMSREAPAWASSPDRPVRVIREGGSRMSRGRPVLVGGKAE